MLSATMDQTLKSSVRDSGLLPFTRSGSFDYHQSGFLQAFDGHVLPVEYLALLSELGAQADAMSDASHLGSFAGMSGDAGDYAVIAEGATVEISGLNTEVVTFTGRTGTLKIDQSIVFKGQIVGLAGADALDLADVNYSPDTKATFLGDYSGGTLSVSDGVHTANIALQGDYLASTWTLSSDGNGGKLVVRCL